MALSPTVRGVLLFVVCFASTGTAPLPRNNNVNGYTSVANNAQIKNLESQTPWRPIVKHRFPSNWTTTTKILIHSERKKYISHSTKNSYLSAQVKHKMENNLKNGKRRDEKTYRYRLPRNVRHSDRDFENWNHLQRTLAINPIHQIKNPTFLNLFRSENQSFLLKKDQKIDIASSTQELREIHDKPFGGKRHTLDGWWPTRTPYPWKPNRGTKRPTPRPYTRIFNTLELLGIFTGGSLAMICFSVCLWYCLQYCRKNCHKSAPATRRLSFPGHPPPVHGFAARMRAALGSRTHPAFQVTSQSAASGRGEGPSAPSDSDLDREPSAPGIMRYSDLLSEDNRRFLEYLNPLTDGDEPADPSRGLSSSTGNYSGTAWRPASGDVSRDGDCPPEYSQVATTDLTSQFGTPTSSYDFVIRRPREPPPPSYDVAYVTSGDAPIEPLLQHPRIRKCLCVNPISDSLRIELEDKLECLALPEF